MYNIQINTEKKWFPLGYSFPMPKQKVFVYMLGHKNKYVKVDSSILEGYFDIEFRTHGQILWFFYTPDGKRASLRGCCTHYSFELPQEEPTLNGFYFNEHQVCLNPEVEKTEKENYVVELAKIGDYWMSGYNYESDGQGYQGGASLPSLSRFFKTKEEAVTEARRRMHLPTEFQLSLF